VKAGEIVLVDWRDAVGAEANRAGRPAVVISDDVIAPAHPGSVVLVPMTSKRDAAIAGLVVALEPTAANGCAVRSYLLAHLVTATAVPRIKSRPGTSIEPRQLDELREAVALCIGARG